MQMWLAARVAAEAVATLNNERSRSPRKKYPRYQLDKAVREHFSKPDIPVDTLGGRYSVPPQTLRNHIAAAEAGKKVAPTGRPPVLSERDEADLAVWCKQRAETNAPVSMSDLQKVAGVLARKRGGKQKFPQESAGRKWLDGFLHRHPDLVITRSRPTSSKLPTRKQWQDFHDTVKVAPYSSLLFFLIYMRVAFCSVSY